MSTKNAKRKLPTKLGQPVVKQSAKIVGKSNLDESRAVVSGGGNATKKSPSGNQEIVTISSDSSSSEAEDAFSDEESLDDAAGDMPMEDAEVEASVSGEEGAEPSFGDLVRANAPEVIDVAGAFEDPESRAIAFPTKIQPPSGASLGTVLTQALKTNDVSLLESCLHTTDVNTIRATIQRLDSPLAGTLLQKLAERLHRRPGRAGSLMVWVQWSLVTHGGYLATQRDLMKKLAGLNRVIDERAKSLPSLLSLKGKLDMLEAQTELRRSLQNQRRRAEVDENDDDVIYVEGEESEDDEEATAIAKPKKLARNGDLVDFSDDDSEVSEDMPNTNGVVLDSEDEEESSEEDNFLDDEAEESDLDEDEVDHEDQDSQSEDEESQDGGAPPPKLQRTSGVFSKKR